jgi:hypothetical protein
MASCRQPPEKREQAPALQERPVASHERCEPSALPTIKLRSWPHSPAHRLRDNGTYIATAGTYTKAPLFRGSHRLTKPTNCILELTERYGWSLQGLSSICESLSASGRIAKSRIATQLSAAFAFCYGLLKQTSWTRPRGGEYGSSSGRRGLHFPGGILPG